MPYRLARSRFIQDWIQKEFDIVHNDSRDYYELSVEIEPREKEEERITRMLHDSVSSFLPPFNSVKLTEQGKGFI